MWAQKKLSFIPEISAFLVLSCNYWMNNSDIFDTIKQSKVKLEKTMSGHKVIAEIINGKMVN